MGKAPQALPLLGGGGQGVKGEWPRAAARRPEADYPSRPAAAPAVRARHARGPAGAPPIEEREGGEHAVCEDSPVASIRARRE